MGGCTEATRAGIIELLFKRRFLHMQGKEIRATAVGRQFISCLPPRLVLPDMTAQWEAQLEAIAEKKLAYRDFMQPLQQELTSLLQDVAAQPQSFQGLAQKGYAVKRRRAARPRRAKRAA